MEHTVDFQWIQTIIQLFKQQEGLTPLLFRSMHIAKKGINCNFTVDASF